MGNAYRICPLCEAGCGLEVKLDDDRSDADPATMAARPTQPRDLPRVTRIRGDRQNVFSRGYICPKGSTLKQLHEDPDWLRQPVVKRDGKFVPVSWEEAFAEIAQRLVPIIEEHGRDSVAIYLGNPVAHSFGTALFVRPLVRAFGTSNVFSASTVDQRPKEVSSGLMFGHSLTVPVPDIDRTDYMLMLGANPYASNGSLATAPDWPGRIKALLDRDGRLVVVDPRRTRTAEAASEHVAIRPGVDPFLLMAMVQVLGADGLVSPGRLAPYVTGIEQVLELAAPFIPEVVAPVCGIAPETIRRLAAELAGADTACVYGRMGTTTTEFGTLTSWLVDVLNVLTGNLDRPGGAMFAKAAAGATNTRGPGRYGRGVKLHRRRSRVRGLPETFGELPVACLAEEIDTPGEGQVRALLTVGGNPVVSAPNAGRLDAGLATLEVFVAVDPYINETTRHADVILPPPSPLQRSHYDLALLQLAVRNVTQYSPPVLPLAPGQLEEWEVLAKLALIAQGMGGDADPGVVDDLVLERLLASAVGDESSPVSGREPQDLVAALGDRRGPERLLDFLLRTGPYGEGFGADPDGLSLDRLLAHPHGIDLGPLEPRVPEVLRTTSGMIELAPELLVTDVDRLRARLEQRSNGLVLVGRRDLRSNNSWMHNVEVLVKGKPRCTLQVHPDDARKLQLVDGEAADVRSRTGAVTIPVQVTETIQPGVVSIPHGWGHDSPGVELSVARRHAGVNSNLLADEELVDPVSGTAVLNGIPVEVAPATSSP